MHFWNFMLLCWGCMFLPLISHQQTFFWQCKNKLSYKISTKMVMNIFNSYLEKNKLCYEISISCKRFQDNPQILNFSIMYFTYYGKTFAFLIVPKCWKQKSFFPLSSCVEWLRNQLGRLAKLRTGKIFHLPQTDPVMFPCLEVVSRAYPRFVGRSYLWRMTGTFLPTTRQP